MVGIPIGSFAIVVYLYISKGIHAPRSKHMSFMSFFYPLASQPFSLVEHSTVHQVASGFQNVFFAALALPWRCPGWRLGCRVPWAAIHFLQLSLVISSFHLHTH